MDYREQFEIDRLALLVYLFQHDPLLRDVADPDDFTHIDVMTLVNALSRGVHVTAVPMRPKDPEYFTPRRSGGGRGSFSGARHSATPAAPSEHSRQPSGDSMMDRTASDQHVPLTPATSGGFSAPGRPVLPPPPPVPTSVPTHPSSGPILSRGRAPSLSTAPQSLPATATPASGLSQGDTPRSSTFQRPIPAAFAPKRQYYQTLRAIEAIPEPTLTELGLAERLILSLDATCLAAQSRMSSAASAASVQAGLQAIFAVAHSFPPGQLVRASRRASVIAPRLDASFAQGHYNSLIQAAWLLAVAAPDGPTPAHATSRALRDILGGCLDSRIVGSPLSGGLAMGMPVAPSAPADELFADPEREPWICAYYMLVLAASALFERAECVGLNVKHLQTLWASFNRNVVQFGRDAAAIAFGTMASSSASLLTSFMSVMNEMSDTLVSLDCLDDDTYDGLLQSSGTVSAHPRWLSALSPSTVLGLAAGMVTPLVERPAVASGCIAWPLISPRAPRLIDSVLAATFVGLRSVFHSALAITYTVSGLAAVGIPIPASHSHFVVQVAPVDPSAPLPAAGAGLTPGSARSITLSEFFIIAMSILNGTPSTTSVREKSILAAAGHGASELFSTLFYQVEATFGGDADAFEAAVGLYVGYCRMQMAKTPMATPEALNNSARSVAASQIQRAGWVQRMADAAVRRALGYDDVDQQAYSVEAISSYADELKAARQEIKHCLKAYLNPLQSALGSVECTNYFMRRFIKLVQERSAALLSMWSMAAAERLTQSESMQAQPEQASHRASISSTRRSSRRATPRASVEEQPSDQAPDADAACADAVAAPEVLERLVAVVSALEQIQRFAATVSVIEKTVEPAAYTTPLITAWLCATERKLVAAGERAGRSAAVTGPTPANLVTAVICTAQEEPAGATADATPADRHVMFARTLDVSRLQSSEGASGRVTGFLVQSPSTSANPTAVANAMTMDVTIDTGVVSLFSLLDMWINSITHRFRVFFTAPLLGQIAQICSRCITAYCETRQAAFLASLDTDFTLVIQRLFDVSTNVFQRPNEASLNQSVTRRADHSATLGGRPVAPMRRGFFKKRGRSTSPIWLQPRDEAVADDPRPVTAEAVAAMMADATLVLNTIRVARVQETQLRDVLWRLAGEMATPATGAVESLCDMIGAKLAPSATDLADCEMNIARSTAGAIMARWFGPLFRSLWCPSPREQVRVKNDTIENVILDGLTTVLQNADRGLLPPLVPLLATTLLSAAAVRVDAILLDSGPRVRAIMSGDSAAINSFIAELAELFASHDESGVARGLSDDVVRAAMANVTMTVQLHAMRTHDLRPRVPPSPTEMRDLCRDRQWTEGARMPEMERALRVLNFRRYNEPTTRNYLHQIKSHIHEELSHAQ